MKLKTLAVVVIAAFSTGVHANLSDDFMDKLIRDDSFIMTLQARAFEVQQKDFVKPFMDMLQKNAIHGDVAKKYQLIEVMDFNCEYCVMAQPTLDKTLALNTDVSVSYIPLLQQGSPKFKGYAVYGLTKVEQAKQKDYLKTMYDLLNRNTVSFDDVKAELEKFNVDVSDEKAIDKFISDQEALTSKILYEMRLQGTPSFILRPTDEKNSKVEVIFGEPNLSYLPIYKEKLKGGLPNEK